MSAIVSVFYNNPDQYPPIINGTRLLSRDGFGVEILCRENGQSWNVAYPADIRVVRLDTRSGGSWREYLGFVRQVMKQADRQAAIYVGHDMHGLLPARFLAYRYRRPLVYHCHDFAEQARSLPLGSRIVRFFERCFARSADLMIVPDRDRAIAMEHELHLIRQPMIVANAPLTTSSGNGVALRQALTERQRSFSQILFRQGRVGAGHALEATIRSMPYWHSDEWSFVILGYGEPDYIGKLTDLARSLGVANRLVVLPPVGYDQVAKFTSGADVGHALYDPIHINFVHYTTASNKIMEYMAAGLPLLVSDRPSLRKFVETYQCGIVADESSPESIATAVNCLLGDPHRAREMGLAARQAFEQEFCYEKQFAPALDALRLLSER